MLRGKKKAVMGTRHTGEEEEVDAKIANDAERSQSAQTGDELARALLATGFGMADLLSAIRFARREGISVLDLIAPPPADLEEAAVRFENGVIGLIAGLSMAAGRPIRLPAGAIRSGLKAADTAPEG